MTDKLLDILASIVIGGIAYTVVERGGWGQGFEGPLSIIDIPQTKIPATHAPPLIPPSSHTLAPPHPEPQTLIGPVTSETKPSKIKKSENDKIKKEDEKKKKKKKLTIPANFPSDVTISPGESPYPEDEGPQYYIPPEADQEAITTPTTIIGGGQQGRLVGRSRPSTGDYHGQKIDPNGCYLGKRAKDSLFTCRAGIGTNPGGKPAYEAGNMTTKVSDLLGSSKNFHLIYHFTLGHPSSSHFAKGGGGDKGSTTEVTAGYDGSSSNETATGITIGIRNGNGDVMARTEDHNDSHKVPGEYRELCKEGSGTSCGGVSHIPEFSQQNGGTYGKTFDIIWVGRQISGGVNYQGYVKVGNNTYLIFNMNNPKTGGTPGAGSHAVGGGTVINYLTQHNYFCRGRTDGAGSSKIVGELWADDNNIYVPSGNIRTKDGGYYYHSELGYMTTDYLV